MSTAKERTREPGSEVVAVIPAAGRASRLGPLPCSKEIYPLGWTAPTADAGPRPKVVAQLLLERLREAGIDRAFFVLRAGKWDIPAYLQDGGELGMRLAYLALPDSASIVETIDRALPFVAGSRVALGFPDVLFDPADAFTRIMDRQAATGAEVVLGLFPTGHPGRADMVETDPRGRVRRILVKPGRTELQLTWMVAVWSPSFSRFFREWFRRYREDPAASGLATGEPYPGHVVQAAVDAGMWIDSVAFPEGFSLDVGTGEDLLGAVRRGLPVE